MAVSLPVLIAMGQTMKQLQGPALVRHQHNQGQLESCWKALGISLLFMLAVLVMIIVAVELIDPDPLVSLDVQMNSRL